MKNLISNMQQFVQDEDGVTAIEYGLIASLIGVAIIVTVTGVGTSLNGIFSYISSQLVPPAA
ncbi:MAG: Flp family type IVb pilin [Bacteroidota bacterium]